MSYFHGFVRMPLGLNMLIKGIVSFVRGTLSLNKEKEEKNGGSGVELKQL